MLGMAKVIFEDYTIKAQTLIDNRINAVLEECACELESQVKRNSRVGIGNSAKTKNSFMHRVLRTSERYEATIGSSEENAIWEEFGTGEFALNRNGRKGAWYVPVDGYVGRKPTYNGKVVVVYGKEGKKFYKTNGKKPSRAFWKAYTSLKSKIIKRIQEAMKGL